MSYDASIPSSTNSPANDVGLIKDNFQYLKTLISRAGSNWVDENPEAFVFSSDSLAYADIYGNAAVIDPTLTRGGDGGAGNIFLGSPCTNIDTGGSQNIIIGGDIVFDDVAVHNGNILIGHGMNKSAGVGVAVTNQFEINNGTGAIMTGEFHATPSSRSLTFPGVLNVDSDLFVGNLFEVEASSGVATVGGITTDGNIEITGTGGLTIGGVAVVPGGGGGGGWTPGTALTATTGTFSGDVTVGYNLRLVASTGGINMNSLSATGGNFSSTLNVGTNKFTVSASTGSITTNGGSLTLGTGSISNSGSVNVGPITTTTGLFSGGIQISGGPILVGSDIYSPLVNITSSGNITAKSITGTSITASSSGAINGGIITGTKGQFGAGEVESSFVPVNSDSLCNKAYVNSAGNAGAIADLAATKTTYTLPGTLKIKRGRIADGLAANSTGTRVIFPTSNPFTQCYCVFLQGYNESGSAATAATVISISPTDFYARGTTGDDYDWIAIGY